MLIRILTIGKPKKKYLIQGITDYLERLKHYCKIEIEELKEPAKSSKTPDIQIVKLEAEKISSKIQSKDFVISMDRNGEMLGSEGLAKLIQNGMNQNRNSIIFVIGGEIGLDKKILKKSDKILSLSKMTFTHDMSRLILLEQLYRAFTILAGQKYHK